MEITKDTLLRDILTEYPWMREELIKQNEKFRLLDTPLGKVFMRKATIEDLSGKVNRTPERLIYKLQVMLEEHEAKPE